MKHIQINKNEKGFHSIELTVPAELHSDKKTHKHILSLGYTYGQPYAKDDKHTYWMFRLHEFGLTDVFLPFHFAGITTEKATELMSENGITEFLTDDHGYIRAFDCKDDLMRSLEIIDEEITRRCNLLIQTHKETHEPETREERLAGHVQLEFE